MIAISLIVALAIYVWVAVKATRWLASMPSTSSAKRLIALISAAVFILLPIWDEIAGRIYFRHLCEIEGGVKVYKQVQLSAEYWNADGSPRFFPPSKDIIGSLFDSRLEYRGDVMKKYPFNITGYSDVLSERASDNVAGTYTWFLYFGGWVVNNTGLHVTGMNCHGYETTKYEGFVKHVLVPKSSGR